MTLAEKLKIISDGSKTKIFVDGYEIKGIQSVSFEHNIDSTPTLNLSLISIPNKLNILEEPYESTHKK